jgi:hypothetical protein
MLEYIGMCGRIVLNGYNKVGRYDVEWIYLAQNMDKWLAVVSTVMNLRVL